MSLGYDPFSIEDHPIYPLLFEVKQNYPNPFNSTTIIEFSLPVREKVSIKIFDILGRELCILVSQELAAGRQKVIWDGTDKNGHPVSSGIYFYSVECETSKEFKKMIMIR